nr:MAG TPA: transcriptional repressor [Caudoviricetes sp.]
MLDRRLQALRKAGKIKSVPGKGWIKLNGEAK